MVIGKSFQKNTYTAIVDETVNGIIFGTRDFDQLDIFKLVLLLDLSIDLKQ